MSLLRGPASTAPTGPLAGVCAGMVLAVALLADKVALWMLAVFAGSIGTRLLINHLHRRLPPLPVKVAILGLGLAAVQWTYGGLLGIEPGMGILLLLVSLKLLETNTVRDFQVLVLLGWFLCLGGLFFSQSLATSLYLGAVSLWLAACLVRFHQTPKAGGMGSALALATKLLLQAAPMVVILFFFFPRQYGGVRFQFSQSPINMTGMSDRLAPGSVASLAESDQVAFRVDIPAGQMPPLPQLYWRGAVLWRGDGLFWTRGPHLQADRRSTTPAGPAIRQRFMLQPHGGRWIFALDRPSAPAHGLATSYEPGAFLESVAPIMAPVRYEVTSRPEARELSLPPDQRAEALAQPTRADPRAVALVQSWRAAAASDRDMVDAALRFFRKEKFTYSLSPKPYGDNALGEFLFERKAGFCEHYAAAFATLMRLGGVPSRVVIGYQGGEFNQLGNYVVVRQFDAHAWAEVWLSEAGWVRVDPTDVIAPDRIAAGSEFFREVLSRRLSGRNADSAGGGGLQQLARDARLFWDNLKFQWDLRVLNYDEESQSRFMESLRLGAFTPAAGVLWAAVGGLLVVALVGLLRLRAAAAGSPAQREYERFCRRMAAAGLERLPWEGPLAFSHRAARAFPEAADVLQRIADAYISLRYAARPAPLPELRRAVKALPRLRRISTPAPDHEKLPRPAIRPD